MVVADYRTSKDAEGKKKKEEDRNRVFVGRPLGVGP